MLGRGIATFYLKDEKSGTVFLFWSDPNGENFDSVFRVYIPVPNGENFDSELRFISKPLLVGCLLN